MKRLTGFLVVAALTLLLVPQSSAAQSQPQSQPQSRPQTREGFFIGFGFGWGSLGCKDCGSREAGVSGYLKLGGTVNDRLLLGFESNGWAKEQNGVTLSQGNASAVAYFYPTAESGFFLKGGLGISTLKLDVSGFGSGSVSGSGVIIGLGYDARVGDNFSLTPYANLVASSFDGGDTNVLQAGLGLTWH